MHVLDMHYAVSMRDLLHVYFSGACGTHCVKSRKRMHGRSTEFGYQEVGAVASILGVATNRFWAEGVVGIAGGVVGGRGWIVKYYYIL